MDDDQLTQAERRALDAWVPFEPSTGFVDRVLDTRIPEVRARRGQVAALALGLLAVAAIVTVIVTRRGPSEERSTVVSVPEQRTPESSTPAPAARPPGPGPATTTTATTGIRVEHTRPFEIRAPFKTTWVSTPAGAHDIAVGSRLRFTEGPARIDAWGTMVDVRAATEIEVNSPSNVVVVVGRVIVRAPALVHARVPGGSVMLLGPSEVEISVRDGVATIAPVRGYVRVDGKGEHEVVNTGDLARIDASGAMQVARAPTTEADVRFSPAPSLYIHDPRPPTAVRFELASTCPGGGIVELATNDRFEHVQRGGRGTIANLLVEVGTWSYRVRCFDAGSDTVATSGTLHVMLDTGTRRLPPSQPAVNKIDADGRSYRIAYPTVIPTIEFRLPASGGKHFRLHLARDGRLDTFDGSTPSILVPGYKLADGQYTYWFDRDGVKDATVSTLTLDPDHTAPQLRLDAPADRALLPGTEIVVRGSVLPGWMLSYDGIEIPVDLQGRFMGRVTAPAGNAFVLRAEHPARGVHFHVRRP